MSRPPIHPGEILREELDFLEISAAELARTLDVPPNRVSQILNGKRAITVDTALRLGRWLGTSPEFWLNLQRQYDLRVAEMEVNEEIRRTVIPLDRSSIAYNESRSA
jgi:addiction module HigA family antidote